MIEDYNIREFYKINIVTITSHIFSTAVYFGFFLGKWLTFSITKTIAVRYSKFC